MSTDEKKFFYAFLYQVPTTGGQAADLPEEGFLPLGKPVGTMSRDSAPLQIDDAIWQTAQKYGLPVPTVGAIVFMFDGTKWIQSAPYLIKATDT